MRAESTRLIWPAPTPSVMPSAAEHDRVATSRTWRPSTRTAGRAVCCGVGCAFVTTLQLGRAATFAVVGGLHRAGPPPTRLSHRMRRCRRRRRAAISSTRTFCFASNTLAAPRRERPARSALRRTACATACGRGAHRAAVEGDDAAEGRGRIGLERLGVGLERIGADARRRTDWRA